MYFFRGEGVISEGMVGALPIFQFGTCQARNAKVFTPGFRNTHRECERGSARE